MPDGDFFNPSLRIDLSVRDPSVRAGAVGVWDSRLVGRSKARANVSGVAPRKCGSLLMRGFLSEKAWPCQYGNVIYWKINMLRAFSVSICRAVMASLCQDNVIIPFRMASANGANLARRLVSADRVESLLSHARTSPFRPRASGNRPAGASRRRGGWRQPE